MLLLLQQNLGFAWGSVAVINATADVTVTVRAKAQTIIVLPEINPVTPPAKPNTVIVR
jgi:hypothetical protein